MGVIHRVTCLRELRAKREREEAERSAALLIFRQAALAGGLDDKVIAAHAVLLEEELPKMRSNKSK